VFVATLFASSSMAKVGHDGGKIRHPEILGSTQGGGEAGGGEADKSESGDHDVNDD
jgi:hypothetical protein